ncbi:NAD(P)/FAD-dependent oxidoreductase [Pseudoxanthomonas koreensis]|uniref:NAD(P)/FAD-dependent oxidoreductase n=1 Tax=Pseudoxanthomonas koreensis TaxID=266061 RepID=UPI0035A5AB6A
MNRHSAPSTAPAGTRPPSPSSWYADSTTPLPLQPALCGRIDADVCILGAGYTGLSAALDLAQAGYRVVVLEAQRVGWGASGRNGGQALPGYGCEPSTLENLLGQDAARVLFDLSREGVELLRTRIARHGIACDWHDGHAHVAVRPRQVRELRAGAAWMAEKYGYPLQWWDRQQLRAVLDSDRYLGAVYDPAAGHLHPLAYAFGLARAALAAGVRIHEHSPVQALVRGTRPRMRTADGEVVADFAVIAGNAHLRGIAPELESRIMPVGTYVAATAPLGQARAQALIGNDMAVADVNWALDYFRLSRDQRLLFGGRASYSRLPPRNLHAVMRRRIRMVFPQLADVPIQYLWGGEVDISLNRAPHWGRLTPNVYFAQGFSGHGVASTGLAGRLIAEAIGGQAQRLDLFARIPHAPFPGGRVLRTPLLVLAMAWYKLRDALW